MQVTLKPDTELKSVRTRFDNPIQFVTEDFEAPLWIYSFDAYGSPTMVISADSWESAYEACIDELTTIPASEVYEAYGFDDQATFDQAVENDPDSLDLDEGYRYQSNCTGTGIVNVGYCEGLNPLTTQYLKESGIKLTIGEIE